ncbi:MAG: hypothetical protein K2M98_00130 [Muribaculum sp.]|nr:hypothetical protein [Muribaculum sp.]
MKKFLFPFLALILAGFVSSCSSEDNPTPPAPTPEETHHFDIWVAVDRHGGMARDVQTIVSSVSSLEADQPMVTFTGTGAEVNNVMTMESIVKGAYYYQVPVVGDRFAKYVIENDRPVVVKQRPFAVNTYSPRKYCFAWLSDTQFIIIAANGAADKIIWTKLDTDLNILGEGTLDIPLPQGSANFTTSGQVAYRKADNKLFYFYYGKTGGSRGKRTSQFYVACIDAATMNVEHNELNASGVDEMTGTAYGELLQHLTMQDEAGNIYLCTSSEINGKDVSALVRIKPGEYNTDPTYNGFPDENTLLRAVIYVGNGKALAYVANTLAGNSSDPVIDRYYNYYAVVDLASSTNTRVAYNGTELPYSGGRFSDRMAALGGKAYFGINPEDAIPCIYIYNSKTNTIEKGREVEEGFYFEQIRILENLN